MSDTGDKAILQCREAEMLRDVLGTIVHHKRTTGPIKLSHDVMVRAIMSNGKWWTPRTLRDEVYRRFGADIEAITAAIRRLRQPPYSLEVPCERVPGEKAYRYRVVL